MAVKKTLTDLFQEHLGAHEYDDFVTKMIKWYYNGGFAKVAWCAISMSYMANQLGILPQFGGRNQNCYEMLCDIKTAVKKSDKGKLWMRDELTKGMSIRRGDVVFILKSDPPMNAGSAKHVTTVYEGFVWKGTSTFRTLGGNQSDYIQVKVYPQSQIYAVFRPDYVEEEPKKDTHPTLRKGDKGVAVKDLQTKLRTLGFANISGKEMVADGKFGRITKATVVAYQTLCGLKPDGIVGTKQTWPMIDEMLQAKPTKTEAITNVYNRVGPGSGYKKIGLIKDGTAATMTTILDGWGYIPAKGGWSMTKYFKL